MGKGAPTKKAPKANAGPTPAQLAARMKLLGMNNTTKKNSASSNKSANKNLNVASKKAAAAEKKAVAAAKKAEIAARKAANAQAAENAAKAERNAAVAKVQEVAPLIQANAAAKEAKNAAAREAKALKTAADIAAEEAHKRRVKKEATRRQQENVGSVVALNRARAKAAGNIK